MGKRTAFPWSRFVAASLVSLVAAAVAPGGGLDCRSGLEIESEMFSDPRPELPQPETLFSSKFMPLWLQALDAPEIDLRRQAADAIASAHRQGMPGTDVAVEPLIKTLDSPDAHPIVALAAARALVTLEAEEAADVLLEHALADGLEMAQIVEPALARWDYEPIRQAWLERLTATSVPDLLVLLAIRGLGSVGDEAARPGLLALALSLRSSPGVRVESARALGRIQQEGLEQNAAELAADRSSSRFVDRLVAASMLGSHGGRAAVELLLDLGVDPDPAVQAIALERLLEIDPNLVLPLVDQATASGDAKLRQLGAEALVARPSKENVRKLGPMLDDRHPDVRVYVRQSLQVMAAQDNELAEVIVAEAVRMLSTRQWRSLEQASLLLVALDHKPAAARLVELLEFERPEVFVTAAWGLGRLGVAETLGAMFEKVRQETEKSEQGSGAGVDVDRQVGHLIQALGRLRYSDCEPLLKRYIPKDAPFQDTNRAAAIWALGHLHAGRPQPGLVKLFQERLADIDSEDPESDLVGRMSATSLGRMNSEDSLAELRQHYEPGEVTDDVEFACAWAVQQITGEPIPEATVTPTGTREWFLEPIAEKPGRKQGPPK